MTLHRRVILDGPGVLNLAPRAGRGTSPDTIRISETLN
jgi:hypothetical protein